VAIEAGVIMSALAIAMFLTGAGGSIDEAQRRRRPPPPQSPPMMMLPPAPIVPLPPPPPPPPGGAPPQRQIVNLNAYFSPDDYPAAAMRANEQGTTGFLLLIESDGRVAHCRVTRSSGSAALDVATCQVLKGRARYAPARDAAGNPARGTDSGWVTWALPSD
jgi:periplasmic protein TonB